MKTYLSLARAAALAGLSPEQLKVLCEAGRLECKKTNDEWFVAEDELVETLATVNRDLVLAEIDELVRSAHAQKQLTSTRTQTLALRQVATGILAILLVALGVTGFRLHLLSPSGAKLAENTRVIYDNATHTLVLPLSSEQVATVAFTNWHNQFNLAFAEGRTRFQANLRALVLPN